eukprot:183671_1
MSLSTVTHYANIIGIFIALCHNIFIFFLVYMVNLKKGKELANTHQFTSRLYYGTLITISSFTIYNITQSFSTITVLYERIGCHVSTDLAIIGYGFGKFCVWMFSLLRLKVLFHSEVSSFGYSKCTLRLISIIFISFFIVFVVSLILVTESMVVYGDGFEFCSYKVHNEILAIIAMMLDQSGTICCFVLFIIKMRLIMSLNENEIDLSIAYISRKYAILIIVNIVSSWIVTGFGTFTGLGVCLSAIDSMVNIWTIVLFDKRYDDIYQKMCGCCSMSKKMNNIQNLKNISQDQIASQSSQSDSNNKSPMSGTDIAMIIQ